MTHCGGLWAMWVASHAYGIASGRGYECASIRKDRIVLTWTLYVKHGMIWT